MFKVVIEGKTIEQFKENVVIFYKELIDKGNTVECLNQPNLTNFDELLGTQEVEPIVALPAMPLYETPFPPAIAAHPFIPGPVEVPTAPAPAATSGSQPLDSKWTPWDERIHSATKATNKDGTWRTRRGVEPKLVETIEAQIRVTAPKTTAVVAPPPPIAAPFVPTIVPPEPVAPPVVAPLAPTPPIPSPSLTLAHTFESFKQNLVATLAKLVADGKLTQDYINQIKTYFGVEQIWKINDEQLSQMFQQFVDAGLLTKVG